MPKKEAYETMNPMYWNMFAEEWPEFDPNSEKFIALGNTVYFTVVIPKVRHHLSMISNLII